MCWNEPRHDKTNKVAVRPVKTQISLGIRPVWPESSLSAWRKLESLPTHWAHSEDSDQTGRMPRLIWVFAWTPIRLGGCPGWSESSLGANSFCWFCHVVAQIVTAGLEKSTCLLYWLYVLSKFKLLNFLTVKLNKSKIWWNLWLFSFCFITFHSNSLAWSGNKLCGTYHLCICHAWLYSNCTKIQKTFGTVSVIYFRF